MISYTHTHTHTHTHTLIKAPPVSNLRSNISTQFSQSSAKLDIHVIATEHTHTPNSYIYTSLNTHTITRTYNTPCWGPDGLLSNSPFLSLPLPNLLSLHVFPSLPSPSPLLFSPHHSCYFCALQCSASVTALFRALWPQVLSTALGPYWYPIQSLLDGTLTFLLANQIAAYWTFTFKLLGNKMLRESQWTAIVLLDGCSFVLYHC